MPPDTPRRPIAIRSYGAHGTLDRHDFSQIVLPLSGELHMEIDGRGARVNRAVAAYVDAGLRHDQRAGAPNRSLILDLHTGEMDARARERLARTPYIALVPEASALVDYMGAAMARGALSRRRLGLWIPLLIDALLGEDATPLPRLSRLAAMVQDDPGRDWTVDAMAAQVGVGASRLHALVRQAWDTTPRAWLSALRLDHVCRLLADTDVPVADLALRAGYSDQSALTRAMRASRGVTPAAYRRQARDAV